MEKKDVLVLFKTHLDIGFTDFSKSIIDKYIYKSIPKAIEVGYALKGTKTKFVWTLGAWMVNEALKHDESGIVDKAIRDGIIVWHALPFTTHTELMSAKIFEETLKISQKLDKKYNKKTIASKMTDVPGHTMGMIPIMSKYGIKFLHIGVNPATPLPDVPQIFKWKCGEDSVMVMYQKDYGDKEEFDDFIVYFAHTGDNCGPQSAEQVIDIYSQLEKDYPGCRIMAATLEDVAERVLKMENIPVLEKEIGDTWIHGAGTDPLKMSRYRNVLRRIENMDLDEVDLTDSLMLVAEHTWGKDIKSFFNNKTDFTYVEMEKIKDTSEYNDVVASWNEQREYIFSAEKKLAICDIPKIECPDLTSSEKCECFTELPMEISWQLFDNSDYLRYKDTYMRSTPGWAIWDFTKVGLPDYKGGIYVPEMVQQYRREDTLISEYRFAPEIEKEYGLPYFMVEYNSKRVDIKWFNKKGSRLPQAFWVKFKNYTEDWEINKMNRWIKPEDILDSKLIAAVDKGIKNREVRIEPLDSCLVAPYGRNLLKYNLKDLKQDMYFNLYNNIWNTNFPMWYSDDAVFRFDLCAESCKGSAKND